MSTTTVFETDFDNVYFDEEKVIWEWDNGEQQRTETTAEEKAEEFFITHGRQDIAECFKTRISYIYGNKEEF